MTRSRLLLISLLCFASLPLAAQVNDTYVIPAAANSNGAFGTRWMTQFNLFNPQSYPLTISIVYVPTGGAVGSEQLLELPANSSAYSDNILLDLFDVTLGSGALLVATFPEDNPGVPNQVISRAFLVNSNTYNNARSGTYGNAIPGVWTGLEADDITAVVHGVRNIAALGWRTNIGAVNLGRTNVTMYVTVYDADGRTRLRNARFAIPPLAHFQDALPIQIDRATVEFYIEDPSGEAVVFPYAATVDQLSGDPTYHEATLLATPGAIFSKAGTVIDPTNIGRKLDTKIAASVRAASKRLTTKALLIRDGESYRITK